MDDKKVGFLILVGLFIFCVDQFLKWLAILQRGGFFSWGFLSFGVYENLGIAFGIKIPAIVFYPLVFLVLFLLIRKFKRDILHKNFLVLLSLTLIGSGALSNGIDRFFRGHVVDYIQLSFGSVFNLADVAIIVGIILLIWKELKQSTIKSKTKNQNTST